jgi:exopolysaccharide biosynthesis polyprenyl glycosylphosphotransferase
VGDHDLVTDAGERDLREPMQGRIEDIEAATQRPGLRLAPHAGPSARRQYQRLYRYIALTDTFSIAVAMLVAYWVRFHVRVPANDFLLLLLGTPFVVIGVFAALHLYEAFRYTAAEEFRRIILAVSLGIAGLMTLSFWFQADLSRSWVGMSWLFSIVLALAARRIWHVRIGRARAKGKLLFRTLIVGTNHEGHHLADVMRSPWFGFAPIGMVSTGAGSDPDPSLPVLGGVTDLRELIRASGAECVFVASSAIAPEDMTPIAKAVRLEGVEVRVTATLPEVLASRLSVQPLAGVTALSLRPVRLSGGQVVLKLTFDILVSGFLLLVLSPLLGTIAMIVKLSSPGPVLFRQRRVGHRGRPFTMLKFRTMRAGADVEVDQLRDQRGVDGVMFKLRDDPRITGIGRWLRRFSLDELPQLLNVMRGEMSLVGPRPPLPEEVTRYEDWHFDRLEVPPGITGLWQISGRSDLSFDDCVRLDLFYIENWSLAYDLYILAKTMPVLLSQRGAY